MPRLAILVPYRDRAEHRARLLPHLADWFARQGPELPRVVLAEQADALPFNRGALLNAAFLAAEGACDYVCFHDVDYLPLEADYSLPEQPTRIIWWGMHERPIRLGKPGWVVRAGTLGLGAVSLFPCAQFRAVNGYANRYFGWGFEDTDLVERCLLAGLRPAQRNGRFLPLDHDNAGFTEQGEKSPAWLENERRFGALCAGYKAAGRALHGLSDFAAAVAAGPPLDVRGPETGARLRVETLLVRLD